jgi:uncharacterized protein with FMN-binding domain
MTSLQTRSALAALAMISLTTVAGCASSAPTTGTDDAATTSGDYADGTYTEAGDYQAPSGTESVEVTVTLADNVVTDLEVVGEATDAQAKLHQGEFIDGVSDLVVGKNIDEISVDKVGGSSLTSGGFNKAIAAIKADAAE